MNHARQDIARTLDQLTATGDLTICKRTAVRAGGIVVTIHTPDGLEVINDQGQHFGTFA